MTDIEQVRASIYGAAHRPDDSIVGAEPQDLAALEEQLGRPLPEQLAQVLTICNGSYIGQGGLYGYRSVNPFLEILDVLEIFPSWSVRGWIPVSSDGCGNYYVLLQDGSVGFIETMSDSDAIECIEAPDLFSFIELYLADEQRPLDETGTGRGH